MSRQEDAEREALLRRAPPDVRKKMWKQRAYGALLFLVMVLAVAAFGVVRSNLGFNSAEQQRQQQQRQENQKRKDYLDSLDLHFPTLTPKTPTPSIPR